MSTSTSTLNPGTTQGAATAGATKVATSSSRSTKSSKAGTPTWARPHREGASNCVVTGIYARLVEDWVRTCELPSITSNLRKWAKAQPALAGIKSLPELLDTIDSAGAERTDEILLALIHLTHDGQQLAGKVVLQAMLPKLSRMAATATMATTDANTMEERRQVGIGVFWDVLTTYPTERRTRRIAGNLALDTLHRLTETTRAVAEERPVDMTPGWRSPHPNGEAYHGRWQFADDIASEAHADPTGDIVAAKVGDAPDPDGSLLSCVAWGVDVEVISRDEAAMLVRVYAPMPGEDGGHQVVAAQLGIAEPTLRARCSRAVRRLTAAVREHAEGDLILAAAGA